MSDTYKIYCAILGDRVPFLVDVDSNRSVAELQRLLKVEGGQILASFEPRYLILYKVDIDISEKEPYQNAMEAIYQRSIALNNEDKLILPAQKLHTVFGSSVPNHHKIHILIDPLAAPKVPTPGWANPASPMLIEELDTTPQLNASPQLNIPDPSFVWEERGRFTQATLSANDILLERGTHPGFVQVIQERLTTQRIISTEQQKALLLHFRSSIIQEYFVVIDDPNITCSDVEIVHYQSLGVLKQSPMDSDAVKYRANTTYFRPIAWHLCQSNPGDSQFQREGSWPFKIVADSKEGDNSFEYTPRSDFLFSSDSCPRMHIVVCSQQTESDRLRMLLQAGVLVRVVNRILPGDDHSFVDFAIYITKQFIAELYLVYQPNGKMDKAIRYERHATFDLNMASESLSFFFHLYNLPFALHKVPFNIKRHLEALKTRVSNRNLQGFTAAGRPAKRRKTDSNAPTSSHNTSCSDNLPLNQMLFNTKYQVLREVEDMSPHDLPLNICSARGPANTAVILKIVKSRECEIHSFLAHIETRDNHTIPIVEVIPRDERKLIVMHRELVLPDVPSPWFETTQDPLARQFIEGVAFMHNHHVAHLDLKPDNIVLTAARRLLIIDYGASVQVSEPESWISGYRGTRGWVAPELKKDSDREYQPIRADLWSAGRVLQYIARRQDPLTSTLITTLAVQLLNDNPQKRPSMSEILGNLTELKKKEEVDPGNVHIVDPDEPFNHNRISE